MPVCRSHEKHLVPCASHGICASQLKHLVDPNPSKVVLAKKKIVKINSDATIIHLVCI